MHANVASVAENDWILLVVVRLHSVDISKILYKTYAVANITARIVIFVATEIGQ